MTRYLDYFDYNIQHIKHPRTHLVKIKIIYEEVKIPHFIRKT